MKTYNTAKLSIGFVATVKVIYSNTDSVVFCFLPGGLMYWFSGKPARFFVPFDHIYNVEWDEFETVWEEG